MAGQRHFRNTDNVQAALDEQRYILASAWGSRANMPGFLVLIGTKLEQLPRKGADRRPVGSKAGAPGSSRSRAGAVPAHLVLAYAGDPFAVRVEGHGSTDGGGTLS